MRYIVQEIEFEDEDMAHFTHCVTDTQGKDNDETIALFTSLEDAQKFAEAKNAA